MVRLSVMNPRRVPLRKVNAVRVDRVRNNVTRILPTGGVALLVCGSIRRIFLLQLGNGQFVKVSCDANPRVITVGCRSLTTRLPGIRLNPGDALFITC